MTESILDIETIIIDDVAIISPKGEIDVYTEPRFKQEIYCQINSGISGLVVVLDEVAFMDMTGIGILAGGFKRLDESDRKMALVHANQGRLPALRAASNIVGVIRLYGTVKEAIASIYPLPPAA